mgnify:FL=1
MAEVILKDLVKVYPYVDKKPKKSLIDKLLKKDKPVEQVKKTNLQITDKGVVAVQQFNLEIKDGEFIVLVGPSGCGKSTTLRMVAGLEEITEGELYIDGKLCNAIEPKDRDIAMVFQSYALYPHMTIFQNMAYPLKFVKVKETLEDGSVKYRHLTKEEVAQKVNEAAELLNISDYLERKPKNLSGGQRQRVAIGRAIVRNPKVLLMDEPLSNLDAKLRNQMRTEIIKLRQKINTTFIYVTHDQIEAMTLGDRIVIMKDGFIQQVGTPQEVYQHPRNLFVSGFIGNPQMNYFDAKLVKNGDDYEIVCKSGYTVKPCLEKQERLKANNVPEQDIILGVRPDHINIIDDDKPGVVGNVSVSELMGSSSHLHATIDSKDVIAIIQNEGIYKNYVGLDLKFGFTGNVVHMFSKENEFNLEYANEYKPNSVKELENQAKEKPLEANV